MPLILCVEEKNLSSAPFKLPLHAPYPSWGHLLPASKNLKSPMVPQLCALRQCLNNFCRRFCFPLVRSRKGWPLLVNRNVYVIMWLSASPACFPSAPSLVVYSFWWFILFGFSTSLGKLLLGRVPSHWEHQLRTSVSTNALEERQ